MYRNRTTGGRLVRLVNFRIRRFGVLFAALFVTSLPLAAQELPPPSGKVLLTVTGAISHGSSRSDSGPVARFDRAALEAFPQTAITTHTPWTDGAETFRGVLVKDLLDRVGASGRVLRAVALNDYSIDFPVADARRNGALIAIRMNGKPMRVRDRGPLWIVYPWDERPELRNETHHARSIWQLKAIHVVQ